MTPTVSLSLTGSALAPAPWPLDTDELVAHGHGERAQLQIGCLEHHQDVFISSLTRSASLVLLLSSVGGNLVIGLF